MAEGLQVVHRVGHCWAMQAERRGWVVGKGSGERSLV